MIKVLMVITAIMAVDEDTKSTMIIEKEFYSIEDCVRLINSVYQANQSGAEIKSIECVHRVKY